MCLPSDITDPSSLTSQPGSQGTAPPACVPSDAVSQAAFLQARTQLHPTILFHSLRVFLYAQTISRLEGTVYSDPGTAESALLFTACMFHDMGTTDAYNTGPTRFEIEGGDAAVELLSRYPHISREQRSDVWVAIALHTSPQIAERIHSLARLLRLGPKIDFAGPRELQTLADLLGGARQCESKVKEVEETFPRGAIERVLGDAVVNQALQCPDKAPMVSWPGVMLKIKQENPDWDGVNKAF